MKFAILLFNQNLIMLFYLLIGYFLMRRKLVGLQGSSDIARLLLYIVMPTAILNSYQTTFTMEKLKALGISFSAAALALCLSILLSRLFFSADQATERFGAAFSNAGFIGIPLVQMTFGNEAVFYVSSFVALLNILQWTYGVMLLTGDRKYLSFQKIRTNRSEFPRWTAPFYPAVLPPGNHQRSNPYACFHERTVGNDRPRDLPCADSIEITLERPHRI